MPLSSLSRYSTYRTGIPIHRLFEEHARHSPSNPAVVCGADRLTYDQLDRAANQLARHLQQFGLGPGGLVAISLGRTPDVLVAMLAVLKAGGAYVPIQPFGPQSMLRYLLDGANPLVVITHEELRPRLADDTGRHLICLDTEADAISGQSAEPLIQDTAATGLACVFYTSGSTGLPKGSMIEHRNLLNAYYAWEEVYGLVPQDRHLQSTTFEFDVFTADWIRALCSGGTLVMWKLKQDFSFDRATDVPELYDLMVREAVTVMECNVFTLQQLYEHIRPRRLGFTALRLLTVGAEKWYLDEHIKMQDHLGPGVRHINTYGVSEAAVDSTYFELSQQSRPARNPERVSVIGIPFPNTRIHIVDEEGALAAPGTPGEICVGGAGVGSGYLDRPDLTDARFIEVDFDPDGRIYRTGDVGRINDDGLLEYIGRIAFQVEVDSERIEVAEIEAALRQHPSVRDCLVTAVETGSRRSALVAYVVRANGARTIDAEEVQGFLSATLPPVMIPSTIVPLRALPRTPAGKVDRRNLPKPALGALHTRAPLGKPTLGAAKVGFAGGLGKGGPLLGGAYGASGSLGRRFLAVLLTLLFGGLAAALTDPLWPHSTDLSLTPSPWSGWFRLLYVCEWLSFGAGMAFLALGWRTIARHGRPPGRSAAAYLSTAWLLAAWWPQDNWYRITSVTDWAAQAGLVYGFNITLMIAAGVLVWFFASMKSPGGIGGPRRP